MNLVFLSHAAEDRESLVLPVYRALKALNIGTWIDRHDYPYGRTSRSALRDSILDCRHVVFFVTDSMLDQARGWCVQELAWTELLQVNLVQPGGPALVNVHLPLFFVEQSDARFPRSVWQATRDRGIVHPKTSDRVKWAAEQIVQFLHRERNLAVEYQRWVRHTPLIRKQLTTTSGLLRRVTRFEPNLKAN